MPYASESERREAKRRSAKKWRDNNREKLRSLNRRWKAENPDKVHEYHIRGRYGITPEQYEELYQKAGGCCEICRVAVLRQVEEGGRARKACVDHDHKDGKVRGILCHSCNRQLTFYEQYHKEIDLYLNKEAQCVE